MPKPLIHHTYLRTIIAVISQSSSSNRQRDDWWLKFIELILKQWKQVYRELHNSGWNSTIKDREMMAQMSIKRTQKIWIREIGKQPNKTRFYSLSRKRCVRLVSSTREMIDPLICFDETTRCKSFLHDFDLMCALKRCKVKDVFITVDVVALTTGFFGSIFKTSVKDACASV